eukprot:17224_5
MMMTPWALLNLPANWKIRLIGSHLPVQTFRFPCHESLPDAEPGLPECLENPLSAQPLYLVVFLSLEWAQQIRFCYQHRLV